MPDRPTLPEPTGDQGAAWFRADLTAYLNSLFSTNSPTCWASCPEATRAALMNELTECGPAWA